MQPIFDFEFKILVNIFKENDFYIAYSPVLQIATQGKTEKEVKKRFEERLNIFFEKAIEKGDLQERLEKLGWQVSGKKMNPPKEVNVPLELLAAQRCKSTNMSYAIK
ncbi:hypothetical protein ES705_31045 [subsurface metagenome]